MLFSFLCVQFLMIRATITTNYRVHSAPDACPRSPRAALTLIKTMQSRRANVICDRPLQKQY